MSTPELPPVVPRRPASRTHSPVIPKRPSSKRSTGSTASDNLVDDNVQTPSADGDSLTNSDYSVAATVEAEVGEQIVHPAPDRQALYGTSSAPVLIPSVPRRPLSPSVNHHRPRDDFEQQQQLAEIQLDLSRTLAETEKDDSRTQPHDIDRLYEEPSGIYDGMEHVGSLISKYDPATTENWSIGELSGTKLNNNDIGKPSSVIQPPIPQRPTSKNIDHVLRRPLIPERPKSSNSSTSSSTTKETTPPIPSRPIKSPEPQSAITASPTPPITRPSQHHVHLAQEAIEIDPETSHGKGLSHRVPAFNSETDPESLDESTEMEVPGHTEPSHTPATLAAIDGSEPISLSKGDKYRDELNDLIESYVDPALEHEAEISDDENLEASEKEIKEANSDVQPNKSVSKSPEDADVEESRLQVEVQNKQWVISDDTHAEHDELNTKPEESGVSLPKGIIDQTEQTIKNVEVPVEYEEVKLPEQAKPVEETQQAEEVKGSETVKVSQSLESLSDESSTKGGSSESETSKQTGPVIPPRPTRPAVPRRPNRPIPLSVTTQASNKITSPISPTKQVTRSISPTRSGPPPPTKPKPIPPTRANRLTGIHAAFAKNLESRLGKSATGGIPIFGPRPTEEKKEEIVEERPVEKTTTEEKPKTLSDVRKGRARGPRGRKLPVLNELPGGWNYSQAVTVWILNDSIASPAATINENHDDALQAGEKVKLEKEEQSKGELNKEEGEKKSKVEAVSSVLSEDLDKLLENISTVTEESYELDTTNSPQLRKESESSEKESEEIDEPLITEVKETTIEEDFNEDDTPLVEEPAIVSNKDELAKQGNREINDNFFEEIKDEDISPEDLPGTSPSSIEEPVEIEQERHKLQIDELDRELEAQGIINELANDAEVSDSDTVEK
ncbi:hypothetical protein V1514DRAFT_344128 [Lipomyces japonicus]|uniref:uncharacterized protein n=1 Tax=Lipomyces japonicus TaxID=56871 RepID=UPI0034CF311E